MLRHFLAQSLRQLKRYPAQSALAVLGVAIGAANIIMLISITDLGKHQATQLLNELGANVLIISPHIELSGKSLGHFAAVQAAAHIPNEARIAVAKSGSIEQVAAVLIQPGHAGREDDYLFTALQGVTPEFLEMRGSPLIEGRWLNQNDITKRNRVACLGDTVKRKLFGEESAIGQEFQIKGENFTVVGNMEHLGRVGLEDIDNRIYLPVSTVQELFTAQVLTAVFARYRQGVSQEDAIRDVKEQLSTLLTAGESLDDRFSVWTIEEATKLMDDTLGIFRAVLGGIASIALLVAGIGIMNVMLIRVLHRRKEIGVRRAVGANTKSIVSQFLLEGVVLAILGALLGILLGVIGVNVYCQYAQWEPFISPLTVLWAALFCAAVGLVFGSYPALRASRLDPIAALRFE